MTTLTLVNCDRPEDAPVGFVHRVWATFGARACAEARDEMPDIPQRLPFAITFRNGMAVLAQRIAPPGVSKLPKDVNALAAFWNSLSTADRGVIARAMPYVVDCASDALFVDITLGWNTRAAQATLRRLRRAATRHCRQFAARLPLVARPC